MACIQALKIAADMGMGRIIVETGAQELQTALLDDEEGWSLDAAVIGEAILLLLAKFDGFEVMYCPGACNHVAHELSCVFGS